MKTNLILALSALLSLFSTLINASELRLLNTTNARTFASSVADGSSSAFATDEDAVLDRPTCFHSQPNHFDFSGFSWIVVDLGSVISNLTEVYIASDPDSDAGAAGIEVFVATYMRTSAHITRDRSGLSWDSYDECGVTTSDPHSTASATVRCAKPLKGRWLILRQGFKKSLSVCLLGVYTSKIENTCFKMVDPNLRVRAWGNEFRLERHVSIEQCRDSCIDIPSCQGLAFTTKSRRRSTGDCHLFRGPDVVRSDSAIDSDRMMQPINCGEHCQLEQNECNRGQPFKLVRQNDDELNLMQGAILWKIEEPMYMVKKPQQPKILFILRFKGRIVCDAESCGIVNVLLVNNRNEETVCSDIDTDLISLLDHHLIQCQKSSNLSNLGSDVVAIKLIPSKGARAVPKFEITDGYARFMITSTNRQMSGASQSPIHPGESFVFSTPNSTLTTVVPGEGFEFRVGPLEFPRGDNETLPDSRSSTYNNAQGKPKLNFIERNSSESSRVSQRYMKPFHSEIEEERWSEDIGDLESEVKEFNANNESVGELELESELLTKAYNPTLSDKPQPQRSSYSSMTTSHLIQHDAEAQLQGSKSSSPVRIFNLSAISEASTLIPSDFKAARSLTIVHLVLIIAMVSLVILAAIAAVAWFVYVRRK